MIIVLFICAFALNQRAIHAGSELENWCIANGQNWDSVTMTCTVETTTSIVIPLTIAPNETLRIDNVDLANEDFILNNGLIDNISGSLVNNGVLNNTGNIQQYVGDIVNNGDIDNTGALSNGEAGSLTNNGNIINYDSLLSYGPLTNYGFITNYGILGNYEFGGLYNNKVVTNIGFLNSSAPFVNNDTVYNYCTGIIDSLPSGNPVIYFDNCVYLPLVEK